ncbi:hypothetical protein ACPV3A_29520 [Paenibacillus sp. Dod16]|uniref:hypothetical protein n=1 Tax=Paenibacillus sp. Dod16 TaxID=3416392 RepID=UPI003CF0DBD5
MSELEGWALYDSEFGYYIGKNYIYQGERFPSAGPKTEAKVYKTKKVAEQVAARLRSKMVCDFIAFPLNKEDGCE